MEHTTNPHVPVDGDANHPEKPAPAQLRTANQQPGQHQQFQAMDLPKADKFRPSKPFSRAKLILACLNTVFALILLGISIGLIVNGSFWPESWCLLTAILSGASLLWQIADFSTLAARHTPIHPGAQVGVHLVLWLWAIIALLFSAAYASIDYTVVEQARRACGDGSSSSYYYYSAGSYHYCSSSDDGTVPTAAEAARHRDLVRAAVAFAGLMLLVHFVLFVLACVETHRRRRGAAPRVVYLVPAGTTGEVGGGGGRYDYPAQGTGPVAPAGALTGSYA